MLLSVLMGAFWSGIGFQSRHAHREIEVFAATTRQEKAAIIQRLVALKSSALEAVTNDYSCWDEMIQYLRTHDPKWAEVNLASLISTAHVQGVWLYDLAAKQHYSQYDAGFAPLPKQILTPEIIARQFDTRKSARFFLPYGDTVIEIRGSTVHPSKDVKRVGAHYGYFLVGKVWDSKVLNEFSELTGCHILMKTPYAAAIWKQRKENAQEFRMSVPLEDWQGNVLCELIIQSDLSAVTLLRQSNEDVQLQFFWFAVGVVVFLSGCLLYWINLPLKELNTALVRQEPQFLSRLCVQRTEFGELARRIAESFTQKAERAALLQQIQATNAEVTNAYDATIEGWSRALDLRDEETEGHSRRVTEWSVRLAKQMGIEGEALVHLRRGALLHDVGKLGVPDAILLKPGKLTPEEWCVMRMHPTYAYEWLSAIAYLSPALDIPYCHHEKWDGTGYPQGLQGEEIPFAARIFAVIDVWDALTSDRPYRKAMSAQEACDYIVSCSGTHFDPQVVEAFLSLISVDTLHTASFPLHRAA